MKQKSNKLNNIEKSRYSVLTDNLEQCYLCHLPYPDMNEIFCGRNRINSIKYGLCVPLCRNCHNRFHNDRNMQIWFMKKALNEFLKTHTIDEFKNSFRYIKGLDIF